ncbi:MAG: PD-(D/E)XK nuclease family protein [Paludibacteraceae bacterium]|nr:PD-(D/E)XK nuclease family protein [Paludibacteraceae bacterium]
MDNSFLQQTAQTIVAQNNWSALEHITLVLPSHRAGVVLKDEIMRIQKAQGEKAIWAPNITTLTQLQDALSPLHAEDELVTIVRLYKHYLRVTNDPPNVMPLDMFYGWGKQMIADFTNVDVSMEQDEVPNFFENTIAAHELSEWHLDDELKERLQALIRTEEDTRIVSSHSVQEQYEQLWKNLYALYTALREELLAEQKGYSGMRQRAVIEQWETDTIQEQIAQQYYFFVGFNYLLPAELELMKRLRDANKASFFWDLVSDFSTNKKAFSFAQQNSQILGSSSSHRQWGEAKEVTAITCASKEAQAQYVHQWLKENYTAPGQKIGVVICDEAMLEPIIYALPAITLPGEDKPAPINITKGYPLRNTDIYARTIQWLYNQPKEVTNQSAQVETIDQLIAFLFEQPKGVQEIADVEEEEALTWQELLVLESEYQVRTILNKVKQIVSEGVGELDLSYKMLRLLIRRMMESVSMPFNGEPITDIQVMGVLETRMLDFDKLLLLNVEEGIVPQHQADHSFIPYYLRKAYHMQTPDERATIYAYNFFRLISRAQQTTMLFGAAGTGGAGKGMSRFIMQMLVSPQFIVKKEQLNEPNTVQYAEQKPMEETRSLLSTLQVVDGKVLRLSGKPYKLSPSALNTYITCPRSFYFQYVLGFKKKDTKPEVVFEANTLGSFVHHTMEYLYKNHLGCDGKAPKNITAEQIATLDDDQILALALDHAYEKMNEEWEREHQEANHYDKNLHKAENKVIYEYVRNILKKDQDDASKYPLSIYGLEMKKEISLPIEEVGDIRIGGIIDRLDLIGEGSAQKLRVIDYKSGGYNDETHKKKMTATWEELMTDKNKGYVRQTMMYSYAVEQSLESQEARVEPHLYFCSKDLLSDKMNTSIELEGETISNFSKLSDTFKQQLTSKAKELLTTTEFPQCEEKDCPSFCEFFKLCNRKPNDF